MPNEQEVQSREASGYVVIRNISQPGLAFSVAHGWVETEEYDVFTQEEIASMDIPENGEIWRLF